VTAPRTLSCSEIVEMVTDYLEGDLDQPTVVALEEHLRQCPGCDRYVDQIRETVSTLGSITSESLSPQAQSDLLEAFRTFKRPSG
jgi:predicted anti-sigma-YlaC factor YlaD